MIPAGMRFGGLGEVKGRQFAALLSRHLTAGTRSDHEPGNSAHPWTSRAFAAAIGVSETTVARWRQGRALPSAKSLTSISTALFGDNKKAAAARSTLEKAWRTEASLSQLLSSLVPEQTAAPVMLKKLSETLNSAKPEPDGVTFVEREGRVVIAPTPASDRVAAALPDVTQRHPLLIEKLDDLLDAIGGRLDNQPAWRALPRTAQRLRAALDCTSTEVPDRLVELYDRTTALASFIELDDALAKDPAATDSPLDQSFRRPLADFLATAAPWLRSFPSVVQWDTARSDMLARPELFATVRPRLADASALIQAAEESGVLSREDAALVAEPLETAARNGFQSEKAGYRGVANARNLLTTAVAFVAGFYINAASSDFATKSALAQAMGDMFARAEAQTVRLAAELPADLAAATHYVITHRDSFLLKAGIPLVGVPTLPASPTRPRALDMAEVKRLILAGQPPPEEWVPLIDVLDFTDEQDLKDLVPLSHLTALKTLNLRGTKISSISALKTLNNLRLLNLDNTTISDLTSISKLRQIERLFIRNTRISDLRPLSKMPNLFEIRMRNSPVRTLLPIENIKSLRIFSAPNVLIRDIAPIRNLTNLVHLRLDNRVTDISVRPTKVTSEYPYGPNNLHPIAQLYKLRYLSILPTNAKDLSPLKNLLELEKLHVGNSKIIDISPLSNLRNLREITLGRLGVSDLSPLGNLNKLTKLTLLENFVTDLSPLKGIQNLTVHARGQTLRPAKGELTVQPAGSRSA